MCLDTLRGKGGSTDQELRARPGSGHGMGMGVCGQKMINERMNLLSPADPRSLSSCAFPAEEHPQCSCALRIGTESLDSRLAYSCPYTRVVLVN